MWEILFPFLLQASFTLSTRDGVNPNSISCDPAGQIHLLLPHYTDCTKFYTCDHGNEVEMNCPAGTIFDFDLQTCNHKWATECILRNSSKPDSGDTIKPNTTEGNESSTVGTTTNKPKNESIEEVPESSGENGWGIEGSGEPEDTFQRNLVRIRPHVFDSKEEGVISSEDIRMFENSILNCDSLEDATKQVAYRGDCQRYWRCKDHIPQAHFCNDGLFFNPSTEQCDYEGNVKCNEIDEFDGQYLV